MASKRLLKSLAEYNKKIEFINALTKKAEGLPETGLWTKPTIMKVWKKIIGEEFASGFGILGMGNCTQEQAKEAVDKVKDNITFINLYIDQPANTIGIKPWIHGFAYTFLVALTTITGNKSFKEDEAYWTNMIDPILMKFATEPEVTQGESSDYWRN